MRKAGDRGSKRSKEKRRMRKEKGLNWTDNRGKEEDKGTAEEEDTRGQ